MRICYLSSYPPQAGGVPTHTKTLVRRVSHKNKVCVITYGRKERKGGLNVEIKEIPVLDIMFLRGMCYFIGALIMLFILNRRQKIDIVHAQYMWPLGGVALLFRKIVRKKPKVVITAHGSDLIKLGGNIVGGRLIRWIGNSSDRLVCVSRYLAGLATGLGIRKEKVKVIYNGLEASDIPKNSAVSIREMLKIPRNRKVIAFVGSLSEDKGADIFLVLARHLLDRDPNLLFVLVGSGPSVKSLHKYCFVKGMEHNVIFAGQQSHAKSLEYMKAADVLVVPSRVEGFGMTALEGAGLGVPVIANRTGALPEVLARDSLTDNLSGSVRRALQSSRFRQEIVRENRKRAGRFTMELFADETEKMYRGVKRA